MALTERYVSALAGGGGDGTSGNPWTWAEMVTNINAGGAAGNRYNVQNDGTYSRTTTTDTITGSGSSTSPIIIRGYSSTITDGYQGRSLSGAGPLVDTNMPFISYTTGRLNISGSWVIVESIRIETANNGISFSGGSDSAITRCSVSNSSTGASAMCIFVSLRSIIYDCDANLTGASGGSSAINTSSNGVSADSCRVAVVSSAPGISCSAFSVVINNLIFTSGGAGISMTSTSGAPYIKNNTIVGCAGDGIDIITGTTGLQRIIGNMITDNGGYGIDFNNVAVAAFVSNTRFRDNTGGETNLGTDWVAATNYGSVTTDTGGASTDYVDQPGGDYRLIAGSPATSASIPASASMGAYQRDQTGSGPAPSGESCPLKTSTQSVAPSIRLR